MNIGSTSWMSGRCQAVGGRDPGLGGLPEGEHQDKDSNERVKNKKVDKSECRIRNILIVGKSGSGKSSIACALASTLSKVVSAEKRQKKKRTVFILNDKTHATGFQPIEWGDLGNLSNCGLILDDLISATKVQFRAIQFLLNFLGHHKNVSPIIICAHSILNNGIMGLLPYMTEVLLTRARSNVRSLTTILINFKVPKEERDAHVKTFLACNEPFGYFILDLVNWNFMADSRSVKGELRQIRNHKLRKDEKKHPSSAGGAIGAVDELASAAEKREESAATKRRETRAAAERYLKLLPGGGEIPLALFDLLYPAVKDKKIKPAELTVEMCTKTGARIKINLVDFIHTLIVEDKQPTAAEVVFHKYVNRKVSIPLCFQSNNKMKKCP